MCAATAADRAPLSHEFILDRTLHILSTSGVVGFRLKDLAKELNVTIPNLYRYFKDRNDIINSAYARAHAIKSTEIVESVTASTQKVTSADDVWNALSALLSNLADDEARTNRLLQYQALASARTTDAELGDVVVSLKSTHKAITELFAKGQELGLLKRDFSAEALAATFEAVVAGVVVVDVHERTPVSDAELRKVLRHSFDALVITGK